MKGGSSVLGKGGGIDAVNTELALRDVVIKQNLAQRGAGIYARAQRLTIKNSTIANNGALVALGNSTVAHNGADVDNSGGGAGGGIRQADPAIFQLRDSLVAANTVGSSGQGPECDGLFDDGGTVIGGSSGANPGCTFTPLFTPLFMPDAMIGPLADNGGPTKTVKLLAQSPAIGHAFECPKRDQRGVKRPDDDCDSGAFERQGP